MSFVLGIDTGGTYTDGVLLDSESKVVVQKAKAFTTYQDLSIGIEECIDNLGEICPEQIKMVSLSTTLATNAIVEGRGGKVGLILIGYQPTGRFPAQRMSIVSGGHNGKGKAICELNTEELNKAIGILKGKVDTLAISGIFSIRNPEHENQARELVRREWDVPIICAHELSASLGLYERTVTACLNAKLLPIIAELLGSVKQVLKQKKIDVPIMIVKGDGSLISEEIVLERPVETILSGPAASVVGAMFLTGLENFLILDMGGTTTDIGIVKNKYWRMHEEGAIVGGWKTHINTAGISTFGIGGGSYIRVPKKGQLSIGPTRVIPLCIASMRFPNLVEELKLINEDLPVYDGQAVDCWMMIKYPENFESLHPVEQAIVTLLKERAHNVLTLEKLIRHNLSSVSIKSLERAQIIARVSFTPTDALHCLGHLEKWNVDAALEGARILADTFGYSVETFATKCLETITESLALSALQSIASKQGYTCDLEKDANLKLLLEPFLKNAEMDSDINVSIGLNYPIVAIGAPVAAYTPAVGNLLNTKVIIPEHSEVACAIGAAMGKVTEKISALIRPGFVVHAPWGCETFKYLQEARDRILTKGKEIVIENAKKSGITDPEIIINEDKVTYETNCGTIFIEEFYEIIVSGNCQVE